MAKTDLLGSQLADLFAIEAFENEGGAPARVVPSLADIRAAVAAGAFSSALHDPDRVEYDRDLQLRVRDRQVGSGMKHR